MIDNKKTSSLANDKEKNKFSKLIKKNLLT